MGVVCRSTFRGAARAGDDVGERHLIEALPEGTWEFVCHPGYVDTELSSVRTRLRESREQELEVLTSPQARQALQSRGIELISYKQL